MVQSITPEYYRISFRIRRRYSIAKFSPALRGIGQGQHFSLNAIPNSEGS
jgi:hypothetical protein